MAFIIGILTFIMVLNCAALVFLVLIQLPKKDAGAGLAFGGGASDALFGAGSGNVLTKITKYSAGLFFAFAVVLSVLQARHYNSSSSAFQRALEQPGRPVTAPATTAAPKTSTAIPITPLNSTNMLQSTPETPAATVPAAAPASGAPKPSAPSK